MAVFEDVRICEYDPIFKATERVPVECGGRILTVWGNKEKDIPAHYYCARCGVRYEKLPEDEG